MWRLTAIVLVASLTIGGVRDDDPDPVYVSCPGGFIAHSYAECPPVVIHRPPPDGAHGGAGGGLLGGLIGHLL